jgi:hypothetical protein
VHAGRLVVHRRRRAREPGLEARGMVFVTEDKQLWKVDNQDVLWGHESEQLEVLATRNAEKKSIKVEKVVEVRQR